MKQEKTHTIGTLEMEIQAEKDIILMLSRSYDTDAGVTVHRFANAIRFLDANGSKQKEYELALESAIAKLVALLTQAKDESALANILIKLMIQV